MSAPTPTAGDGVDWTTPGTFEVAPGVHRIPLPLPNDGLRAVNVYALDDGDELVLVDSGWEIPQARDGLETALRRIGRSLNDIRRFLVTHAHRDHYSLAISLRHETGARVSLGREERASLELLRQRELPALEGHIGQLERGGATELAGRLRAWRSENPSERPDWGMPDDWLGPGTIRLREGRELEVIETPGHTRGHVVFADGPGGLLFAGDHVLPTITPSIGFEPAISPDPLGAFLGSLARVRAMPDARLLPAHGAVTDSVHQRIDQLVEHHGRRLAETEAAVAAGAETAADVAAQLRWTRRERRLEELDLFNQMLAVTETAAHLTLLVAQGRIVRHDADDGTIHHAMGA